MELCTTIKPRNDGTVIVSLPIGRGQTRTYTFSGEPLACEIEDEEHADQLLATNNFMTRTDFEEEMEFRRKVAERHARQVSQAQRLQAAQSAAAGGGDTFVPGLGDDLGEELEEESTEAQNNAQPQEAGTRPTGRVRRAAKQ
jgi:hypothetical protein